MALEDEIKSMNFRGVVYTAIVTALAFVVGLFWRDAITAAIEQVVPVREGVFYKFVAAVAVTVIVIILVYVLLHAQKVADKRIAKLHKELRNKRAARRHR